MQRIRLSRRGLRLLLGAALVGLAPGEGRATTCITRDLGLYDVQVELVSGPEDGLEEETDLWIRGSPWDFRGDNFAIYVGRGDMWFEGVHQ